jgi:formylglycine-generating enzyme required for sulfatase activity
MLDKRLKWAFFITTLVLAGLPVAGIILDFLKPSNIQVEQPGSEIKPASVPATPAVSLQEDMVLIPAGEFLRGYDGGGFDEKPQSRIMLDAYWIDRYEVTYGAYLAFVETTGHRKPISRYVKNFDKLSAPTQPAVYASWGDADEYCRYRGARLPTEAEWEKAARGPHGLLWPWGNQDKPGAANTGNPDPFEFPSPGASFPQDQSPYGVYDLAGNVMEWASDWYQEDVYATSLATPQGPSNGSYKVIRGASWGTVGKETRLTVRLKMVPDFRDTTIGFRCAKFVQNGRKDDVGKGS